MSKQGDGAQEALSSRERELRLSVDIDERKKAETGYAAVRPISPKPSA